MLACRGGGGLQGVVATAIGEEELVVTGVTGVEDIAPVPSSELSAAPVPDNDN